MYLIEVKYLKREEKVPSEKRIEALCTEAEIQLNKYSTDNYVVKTKGDTELKKIVLVYTANGYKFNIYASTIS